MKTYKKCLSKNGLRILRELNPVTLRFEFALAGGTALALQMGHRISEDLDFFTVKDFSHSSVITKLKRLSLSYAILMEDSGTLILMIDGIKVSFLKYEYPFLNLTAMLWGTPLASTLDIAAMKIIAICQRGTKRDFVDLFFILQMIPFHKIAQSLYERFGKERINPLLIGKSLVYFSDAEGQPEPRYMESKEVKWEKIKIFFEKHVKQFVLDMISSQG